MARDAPRPRQGKAEPATPDRGAREALMNMKVISDAKKGTPFDLPAKPKRGRGGRKKK